MIRLLKTGRHACLGALDDGHGVVDYGDESVERRALLVYPGTFQSMDGPVEVTEDNVRSLCSNYNMVMQKGKRTAKGQVALKEFAPIQVDHSEHATHTVGRLMGPLEVAQFDIPEQGTTWGLFGTMRFLGKENCDKVKDGRWTHVSIGADLDANKINEVSITPFPAAPFAAMLRKEIHMAADAAKKPYREMTNDELDGERKEVEKLHVDALTAKGPDDGTTKMLKNQLEQINTEFEARGNKAVEMTGGMPVPGSPAGTEVESKEEPKGPENLAKDYAYDTALKAFGEANKEFLMAWHEKGGGKLSAAEEPKPGMPEEAKMAGEPAEEEQKATEKVNPVAVKDPTQLARRARLVTLSKSIKETGKSIHLEENRAKIGSRLRGLRAQAKITPAEAKKIDVARLAATNEATIDAVLSSYESREPVIITGIYGNANAPDVSSLVKDARKARMTRLEAETRANMSSILSEKDAPRMPEADEPKVHRMPNEEAEMSSEAHGTHCSHMEHAYKLMEEGKHEEALSKMRACMEHMKQSKMYADTNLTSMAAEVSKLRQQCNDLMKLAAESLQVQENELG